MYMVTIVPIRREQASPTISASTHLRKLVINKTRPALRSIAMNITSGPIEYMAS